jgi:hypothetical protein
MLELLAYLRAHGFKTFIASGGGIEFMRVWADKVYGIPPEQVIGSSIVTKFEMLAGAVLTRLPELNFMDDNVGKPVAIKPARWTEAHRCRSLGPPETRDCRRLHGSRAGCRYSAVTTQKPPGRVNFRTTGLRSSSGLSLIRSRSAAIVGSTILFAHAYLWFVYSIQVDQYCGS